MKPEELVYIKAHIHEWAPPEAPCEALASHTWDAAQIGVSAEPDMTGIRVDVAEEAPIAEAAPEPVRDLVVDRPVESSSDEEEPQSEEAIAFCTGAPGPFARLCVRSPSVASTRPSALSRRARRRVQRAAARP